MSGPACARAAWTAEAAVSATDGRGFVSAVGLASRAAGLFTCGRLVFLDGANAGVAVEVRRHGTGESGGELDLWHDMALPIAVGDRFRVTAGCDRRFETCRDRFANAVNYRGFPHMLGTDFVLRAARTGEAGMDGGSLYR